jgi:radical SAM superfamily enzyme YgiQ (UPF0313 family)
LVLYVSHQSFSSDVLIGNKIKQKTGCEVVLVGPWCASNPEKMLKDSKGLDMVVKREFDDVVLDLANGKKKKDIKGLVYRNGKKIVFTGERQFLTPTQLDKFPFVTSIYKQFLPIKNYTQASLLHPYIDMFTARGCAWNQCTFCLWPQTIHKGAHYRMRNLDGVVEELKYIKKELTFVKEVFFQDDMLPTLRARQISELIIKHKIKMNWSCYVKADVDLETLKMMKMSGCRFLHVGYETPQANIIKNIKKGTQRDTMTKFTQDAQKAGLRIHGDFILGLPGETKETIQDTINWAKSLKIEGYQVFIPQPHPGTILYNDLKKKGHMSKSGDIDYPHLSRQDLSEWRFNFLRQIYFSPTYIARTVKNINSLDEFVRLSKDAFNTLPNLLFPKKFY